MKPGQIVLSIYSLSPPLARQPQPVPQIERSSGVEDLFVNHASSKLALALAVDEMINESPSNYICDFSFCRQMKIL